MTTIALTVYMLVWPVVVACVMYVIGRAFIKEAIDARKRGEPMV